jgi:hypothetical protein
LGNCNVRRDRNARRQEGGKQNSVHRRPPILRFDMAR